jgi:hypothetical protein
MRIAADEAKSREEDAALRRDFLRHQLQSMKLQEKMEAAQRKYDSLHGLPLEDVSESDIEGGREGWINADPASRRLPSRPLFNEPASMQSMLIPGGIRPAPTTEGPSTEYERVPDMPMQMPTPVGSSGAPDSAAERAEMLKLYPQLGVLGRIKPVMVPDEAGNPTIPVRPQTMEELLAAEAAKRTRDAVWEREKTMQTPRMLNPGDIFGYPNEPPLMTNPKPPAEEDLVKVDTMENGKRVTKWLPKSEVKGKTFAAHPPAGEGVPGAPYVEQADLGATDPASQDILSQTGLSPDAFVWVTGRATQLPRSGGTRERASAEVRAWARKKGIDISTLPSQYKAQNDVLAKNIERLNNTQIMESELRGTIQNLQAVIGNDFSWFTPANVAKVWAGERFSDPQAQQYSFHLGQLRNELAAYYAAAAGRPGGGITVRDEAEAEKTIGDGIADGGLKGLMKGVEDSTSKMGPIMEESVDRAAKAIWKLFGVEDKYINKARSRGGETGPFTAWVNGSPMQFDNEAHYREMQKLAPDAKFSRTAPAGGAAAPAGATGYKVGQQVPFQGQMMYIIEIKPNGELVLDTKPPKKR